MTTALTTNMDTETKKIPITAQWVNVPNAEGRWLWQGSDGRSTIKAVHFSKSENDYVAQNGARWVGKLREFGGKWLKLDEQA